MPKKKSRAWVITSIIIIILFLALSVLWNRNLFGKKLPQFVKENLPTLSLAVKGNQQKTAEGNDQTTSGSNMVDVLTPEVPFLTEVPLVTADVVEGQSASERSQTNQQLNPQAASSQKAVCGQTGPILLLGLGIDEQEQADVIRLVRIDFVQNKILVLSIPRDLWVPIPGLSQYGVSQFKINGTYGFGEFYLGKGKGVVTLSNTIYQNFGITFDRYAVFHFSNFVDLINAVGGVDIELDKPIGAYGTSGKTHFDGVTALDYARAREADSDMFRVRRQSAVLNALYKKMLLPEHIIKLPKLGVKFLADKTLITDLTLKDIYSLICFANRLKGDSIVFMDIPSDLYKVSHTNTGRYILLPTKDTAGFVQGFILNGKY